MWFLFAVLSAFCWAMINVLDSVLVHNYEKRPMALMWSQSLWSVPALLVLSQFIPLQSEWITVLIAFGVVGFIGDLWFFHVLEHVDVSVSNLAWALLSVFLAIAGFVIFGDVWTPHQTIGALLIIGATLFLCFFHQRINVAHVLWLIGSLSLIYLPFYIIKKMALDDGESPATVFFWLILSRELCAFTCPLFVRSARTAALNAIRSHHSFSAINAVVIASFFGAEYFGAVAYASGPLSLVAIANNVQPFMVLALAALFVVVFPRRMPRELFTRQSVTIKLGTFLVVFMGLAFLASP